MCRSRAGTDGQLDDFAHQPRVELHVRAEYLSVPRLDAIPLNAKGILPPRLRNLSIPDFRIAQGVPHFRRLRNASDIGEDVAIIWSLV